MDDAGRPRVLFVNRSYWPDAEATGQLLTELCEDLAASFDVEVIAGQPNQNPEQAEFRRHGVELRNGVAIRRVRHTRFSKASFLGRLANYASFFVAALVAAIRSQRPNVIVVETDPPLLCLLGAVARWRHRCRLIVYLQDIYPDVAVAVGKLRDGWLTSWLRRLFFRVYRTADRVVVLSEDMKSVLRGGGVASSTIRIIPNWVDTSTVWPVKHDNAFRRRHDLDGKFVVMYSGNMGLCQRLETVLSAAELLRHRPHILFVLVGNGASRADLETLSQERRLSNVRFFDYRPRSELPESLSAADVHLVSLDPRVTNCLMPSKLYGILASGTALVAVAREHCELSQVVQEATVGLVVEPDNPRALASRLLWCADHPRQLQEMGMRARALAEARYDRRISTSCFAQMLSELPGVQAKPTERPLRKAA